MACSTGQTSAILECICVNGKPLVEYIDGGDQVLQALITSLQACCSSNTAAIATIQGIITTLQGQVHPRLILTQNQDVTGAPGARATLDVTNQVLNLPPAIAGRIAGVGLAVVVGQNTPTPITGLAPDYDTVGGAMATSSGLIIPRTGRYNLSGSWGTNIMPTCPNFVMASAVEIGGVVSGRYSAPSNGLADQVAWTLPGQLLQAGDLVRLMGYSDCAGVVATIAYLGAEYIEGS